MRVFNKGRPEDQQSKSDGRLEGLERSLGELRATLDALASEEGGRARAVHERGETQDIIIREIRDALARMSAEMAQHVGGSKPAAAGEAPGDEFLPAAIQCHPASSGVGEVDNPEVDELPRHCRRRPLSYVDGIPVFAASDSYIEAYRKVAAAHLEALGENGAEPWVSDVVWSEIEDSTRDLIRRFCRDGQRILDVGVGRGQILAPFERLERYGVDISLDYLRIARDAGIDVAFARLEELPYNDAVFDAVLCTDVLEHVPDLTQSCCELLRVLRPGGLLIARTPLNETLEPYLLQQHLHGVAHVRSFSFAELKLLFASIFTCQFIASVPAGYDLGGASQSRFKALPREVIERLTAAVSHDGWGEHAEVARSVMAVDDEQVVSWLRALRDAVPGLYNAVAKDLVHPLEINIVVQKPYDPAQQVRLPQPPP